MRVAALEPLNDTPGARKRERQARELGGRRIGGGAAERGCVRCRPGEARQREQQGDRQAAERGQFPPCPPDHLDLRSPSSVRSQKVYPSRSASGSGPIRRTAERCSSVGNVDRSRARSVSVKAPAAAATRASWCQRGGPSRRPARRAGRGRGVERPRPIPGAPRRRARSRPPPPAGAHDRARGAPPRSSPSPRASASNNSGSAGMRSSSGSASSADTASLSDSKMA